MTDIGERCAPGQIWVPGMSLDLEYPVPSGEELAEIWSDYTGLPSKPVEGVYGAYTPPSDEVTAVASIDLCEVVRQSAAAMDAASGIVPENGKTSARSVYDPNTWYDARIVGKEYKDHFVNSTLQVLMSAGHVEPIEFSEEIAVMLRKWGDEGVYRVANTSTLPGCDKGTIEHSLGRDYEGCFDAILLPRNHDGMGNISKAAALAILATEIDITIADLPMIHIDDSVVHTAGFTQHYGPEARLKLFVPLHTDNHHAPKELQCDSPLTAFVRANEYFVEEGVIHAR